MQKDRCLILIGMPGAGKSTIGLTLAAMLHYAFIDTDFLIESIYARRLQDVTDALRREKFRDVECDVICALQAHNCVIATGGSVIYRARAMAHLAMLGHIIHLDSPLATIVERVALNPERGISCGPGQSLQDLYRERMALYSQYAEKAYNTEQMDPDVCARKIIADLKLC